MAIRMETEHEGHTIIWNDYKSTFSINKDGIRVKDDLRTIRDCEKWITKVNKRKFNRVPILVWSRRRSGYVPAIATSLAGDFVWIVDASGHQSKQPKSVIILDTAENREKAKLIMEHQKEADAIERSLEPLSDKAMVEEEE